MPARHLRFIVGAFAAVLALLAGCGPSATTTGSSTPSTPPTSVAPPTISPGSPVPALSPGPSSSPAAEQAAGLTHVKIGLTSQSTGALYLYLGRDLGIFRAHGIEPEIVIGQPEALETGLVQGDLDFVGVIPPAVQGAEQGLPIRVVFVAKDHPEYVLIGDIGITDVSQLKGRPLGGSPATQAPSQVLSQLLALDGLQDSDYTIVSVANDPARAALVEDHQVAASMIGLAQALPLMDQGYPLIDSTMSKIYAPSNGLAVSLSSLQQRRDVVQRTVDAALEATHIAATDKESATRVLIADFDQSESDASMLFDLLQPTYTSSGRPAPQAVTSQLEADAQAMSLPRPATEAEVYDYSLLPPAP